MKSAFLFLVMAVVLAPCVVAANDGRQYIVNPRPAPLPFSDGVLVDNTLYIAGHLGIDPKTGQAPKDTQTEIKLLMDAVEGTVKSAGLSMDEVTSITVYCTDLALYDTFNAEYRKYFHLRFPARAFIGVATLLRGAHFEIQGVAVKTH